MLLCITILTIITLLSLSVAVLVKRLVRSSRELASRQIRVNQVESIGNLGLWEFNYDTGKVKWSDNIFRILRVKPGSLEPSINTFLSFIHPEDSTKISELIDDVMSTCRNFSSCCRILRADQNIGYIYVNGVFELDKEGKAHRLHGIIQDMTDVREAQEIAESTQKKLDAIFDNSPNAIAMVNEHGELIFQSSAFSSMLGFSADEISGKSQLELVHEADREIMNNFYRELQNGPGKTALRNVRMKHKSGNYLWAEGKAVNLLHDGNVRAIVTTFRDVTSTIHTETSLKNSEANLMTILEHAETAYILVDTELKILTFNTLAAKFANQSLKVELAAGEYGIQYFPQERRKLLKQMFINALDGVDSGYEICYDKENGTPAWYDVKIQGVKNNDGEMIGVIMSLNNFTERKLLEIQREKMTTDLVQRNKDLEQFAYMVSHNLRAPLANIIGLCNLLQMPDVEDKIMKEFIHGMALSANRLDGVIRDMNTILDVKRNSDEKKEEVLFAELLDGVKETLQVHPDLHLTITTDFSIHGVRTIKSYLHSIFYNLISNSIKYRRENVPPSMDISSYRSEGKLVLVFKDNGMGIDMERNREKVFGLYNRFHPDTEGKGMGLFMTRAHVQALGGNISIDSVVNEGTTFKITFPI